MNAEATPILVIDDEPGIRGGCQRALEAEGYLVCAATDGPAGIEMCPRAGTFHLALVDLKMPGMGGMEVIARLRAIDPHLVIVVITAYATIDTAVEATKRGAYAYLPKPFTPDELLVPVRNGLERRSLALEAERLRGEREQRLLEVAYERSKCRTVINCMTDGVLVVNSDRQVVLRNAASGRIAGEWAGLRMPVRAEALDCPPLVEVIDEVLGADREPTFVTREISLGDGVFMACAGPVAEPGGMSMGAVVVLRDITALKKLETAKSMFVSMVSHEVRAPVAAIESNISLILEGYTKGDVGRERELLRRCMCRAGALRQMVSELMNLTAMDTGHFSLSRKRIDLRDVLAEAAESCSESAAAKRSEISLDGVADSPRAEVLGDRTALISVFANLIGNAVKYTPEEGHVRVTLQSDDCCVHVNVIDDGIGMKPEDCARCFGEFFRVRSRDTAGIPGTGLGLTLCHRLVQMHDGRIAVRSEAGKGSTFTVSLNAADNHGGESHERF